MSRKQNEALEEKQFDLIQNKRPWICKFDVPWRIAKRSFFHKLGYIFFLIILSVLILNIPNTDALDRHNQVKKEYKIETVLILIVCIISLIMIQASNPGYLSAPVQEIELTPIEEEKEQMNNIKENNNNEKGEDIDTNRYKITEFFESDQFLLDDILTESDTSSETNSTVSVLENKEERLFLRSRFCKRSKRLVATYDHFCAVLNTPIGEKNHFRYLLFLFVNSVSLVKAYLVCFSGLHDTKASAKIWLSENFHALLFTVIVGILCLVITGLFGFHVFLMMSNLTTFEFMRTEKVWYLKDRNLKDFDLPFSLGLCRNIYGFIRQDGIWWLFSKEEWKPTNWEFKPFERESEDICNNLWENKYYSCC